MWGELVSPCPFSFLFFLGSVALNVIRNLDPQNAGSTLQLAAEEIRHPQQENLLLPIFLMNDGVLVVKIVERLRQLKGVLGHVRGLARGSGALQCGIGLRGGQQHLPEVLGLQLTGQGFGLEFRSKVRKRLAALLQLSHNIPGTNGRILNVRRRFALTAQRLLKIEGETGPYVQYAAVR